MELLGLYRDMEKQRDAALQRCSELTGDIKQLNTKAEVGWAAQSRTQRTLTRRAWCCLQQNTRRLHTMVLGKVQKDVQVSW